jgi:CheY-like chemotaxis protein
VLVALEQWVASGTPPPASQYSRLDRGSLVPLHRINFPKIPGVTGPAGVFNTRFAYYRGPRYDSDELSGIIAIEPPIALAEYPSIVPQVDADGNDIDGLRSHILQAPLGTYTGWNVRAAGFSQGDACDLTGGYIPFAVTKAQRIASGDPRHLALVDVQLPGMTGFELVQKWREHDRSIKVLILSGVAKKAADGLRAGKIRVAEYLVAPFHLRELAFLAKRALLFGKPICPVVGVYSQKKSVGVLRNAVSELMNDKQVEAENDIKTLSFKNRN